MSESNFRPLPARVRPMTHNEKRLWKEALLPLRQQIYLSDLAACQSIASKMTQNNRRRFFSGRKEVAVLADVSRVEPWLYVGAQPGEGESLPAGIRAVINLRRDPPGLCPAQVYGPGVESYLWRPLGDGVCPGLPWLSLTADLAEGFCRRDQPLLIHCLLGVSRSPMVAAAVLMRVQRLRLDAALAKLSVLRRGARPNEAFLAVLKEFEGSLR